jgi:hypothetical protein
LISLALQKKIVTEEGTTSSNFKLSRGQALQGVDKL